MPWVERLVATERLEFVRLAGLEGANRRELCRRFKISPRIGYKWLARFAAEGVAGLTDRSRRPKHSPKRTALPVEAAVLAVREAHPSWGGRKIKAVLAREEGAHLPAASTVTAILRRHGRIARLDSLQRQPCRRFERALPNELWQMDFKGHFALAEGRCHPLTALDDHSRYAVLLAACANEQGVTVQQHLTGAFRQHGLPFAILTDNGSPWGGTWDREALTPFTAWLVRLGIEVHHGRPYHRRRKARRSASTARSSWSCCTVAASPISDGPRPPSMPGRTVTTTTGRYQALGQATPASRYRPSPRPFPETLPPIEYAADLIVRRVRGGGRINLHGRTFHVGKALTGHPVGLRPTATDGRFEVLFCQQKIATIDLATNP